MSDSSQMNFNPSWMQAPTTPLKTNGISFPPDDETNQEIMDPIFSKNRYGREDILALMVKDVKPPDGLCTCPFFVEKAQAPFILQPLNETEVRLQQNINSSKALSALSRQDRNIINGNENSQNSNSKWVVAGGNRSFHSHNKPASHRWSGLNSSGNGSDASSFRSSRPSAQSSFGRSGNRYRISSPHNDEPNTSNKVPENQSLSTSTITNSVSAWNKVGAGKNSNSSKGLKTGENTRVTVENMGSDDGARGGNVIATSGGREGSSLPSNASQQIPEKKEILNSSVSSVLGSSKLGSPDKASKAEREKWYYLDPNGVQRGPYESKQMQTWFDNRYFDSTLQICRVGDNTFFTLGELFLINGAVTPFVSKSFSPTLDAVDDFKAAGVNRKGSPENVQSKVIEQRQTNIWNNVATGSTIIPASSNVRSFLPEIVDFTKSNFFTQQESELQKILLEKQRLLEEEQRKLREKEEMLQKEERERFERERLMREKELELQRKQDELQRIAREKEEELEKRRQQVAEFERQKREALEKIEEKLRNEQLQALKHKEEQRLRFEAETQRRFEAHRLMIEAEERQKLEAQRLLLEAEQRRREEEDANIRAAYEEARRLQEQAAALKAEREQRARLLAERDRSLQKEREKAEELKRKQQEEKAAAERQRREEEQRQQEILRHRQMEEELSKVAIQAILKESMPAEPKVASTPWVTVCNKGGGKKEKSSSKVENRSKTLLEIQQEEEDAMREKLRQQQEMLDAHRKNVQVNSSSTVWSKPSTTMWSTPSTEFPAPNSSKQTNARSWSSVHTSQAVPISKPAIDSVHSKKTQKKQKGDSKMNEAKKGDAFTLWIIKRVKELNSTVDAEVFASFIEGVDSPNEAEDYIIGYLGESKVVKDFHHEFLNKRIELRPRVKQITKDDLSGPAAATYDVCPANSSSGASNLTSSNQSGAGNNTIKKKKKGKPQKVLDPAILGFRATGDPNRINAGEIDTAPPVPTNRRR